MTRMKALSGTTALALALAGPAMADVNGSQVWSAWKSAAESMGEVLTPGSMTKDGDTLIIHDLAISMQIPNVDVSGTVATLEFRGRNDGTVEILIPPSYTMTVASHADGGPPINAELEISQTDLSMIASGDPSQVAYDFQTPEMVVAVTSLNVGGKQMEGDISVTVKDMNGQYLLGAGDMPQVTSHADAGSLAVDVLVHEPGGPGLFTTNLAFADLKTTTDGTMGMLGNIKNMAEMLADGFSTQAEISYGASTYAVDLKDKRNSFNFDGKSDGGNLSVSMDADALAYNLGADGFSFKMVGSDLPLPEIAAGFSKLGFGLLMPLSASEEPQDFALNITLGELSVSDMIWGIVDHTGALPHDPASLIVDLGGKANWLFNILDPEAAAKMASGMPGKIHALDINQLMLSVGGAELTGQGGFTFNNDDLATFDGVPAPTGTIDLKLVGGNGLLDTLVAMGMVPEDQAMGARMMMGMFAQPGDGEDTLTSKIEVDGTSGAISANGQRLQ